MVTVSGRPSVIAHIVSVNIKISVNVNVNVPVSVSDMVTVTAIGWPTGTQHQL